MQLPAPLIVDPPPLADDTVRERVAFLYQLIAALETHYARALRPHQDVIVSPQPDLFDHLSDADPPF